MRIAPQLTWPMKSKPNHEEEEEEENSSNNNQAKKAKLSNGMVPTTEVPDIDYDSLDEDNKRYNDHYTDYDHDKDLKSDDDEDDEDEALILSDISRPLRAWGFNMDGKLASHIFDSVVEKASVVAEDAETDAGLELPTVTVEESSNGHVVQVGDIPPIKDDAESGMGKLSTVNAPVSTSVIESPKKTTPKSGDNNITSKSPSTS
jgi:hypothetical protein